MAGTYNIFFGNSTTIRGAYYEQNNFKEPKYKYTVDTAVDPIPMCDTLLVTWFISSV